MISQDSIDQFLQSLADNGASVHTLRAYRGDLMGFLAFCQEDPVNFPTYWGNTQQAAARWLTLKRKQWKPRTTLRKMAALRSWADFHGEHSFLESYNGPTPAPLEAHPVPGGVDVVMSMIDSAATVRHGRRMPENHHRALIALCGLCGLRVSEAVAVHAGDFDLTNPTERRLSIRGKGDKDRVIYVSDRAWEVLEPSYRRALQSPVYDRLVNLSESGAMASITRHARRAGVPVHVSSHDMRMTAGTAAYEASGGDLRAVQELLGHASSRTTEGYTAVSVAAAKRAANF